MTRQILPYGRQWIDGGDVAAVAAQLESDWLTQGPRVEDFEAALCAATGARHAVAVSSGTAALHLAALAASVGPGMAGVTSAVTFVASANCVAYAGGRPAFADVDPATGLLDVADLEQRCHDLAAAGTPPAVLIPVDFAGQAADLAAVRRIADDFGAKVIEDAAHALGASYRQGDETFRCASCAHADLAVLSFHPVKHITTGEGGAVLTRDGDLGRRLRELRSHGITRDPDRLVFDHDPWYHEQHELGFNYRITDIQCALGLSQLRRLPDFLRRRRQLAAVYDQALREPPFRGRLAALEKRPGDHAYHLYVVRVLPHDGDTADDVASLRRRLFDHLVARGIRPQVHYIPVPRQPWYRRVVGTIPEDYPGAETYYAGCLSLPLFPRMSDADVERVANALRSGLEGR